MKWITLSILLLCLPCLAQTPPDSGNLLFNFNADALSPGAVSTWSASSGTMTPFVLAQAIPGDQPTCYAAIQNGHNAVLFDGVNDYLPSATTFSQAQTYTVVIAGQYLGQNNSPSGRNYVVGSINGQANWGVEGTPTAGEGVNAGTAVTTNVDGGWHYRVTVVKGASTTIGWDGNPLTVLQASPGANTMTSFEMGCLGNPSSTADPGNWYVGNVLVYAGDETANYAAISTYENNIYNTQALQNQPYLGTLTNANPVGQYVLGGAAGNNSLNPNGWFNFNGDYTSTAGIIALSNAFNANVNACLFNCTNGYYSTLALWNADGNNVSGLRFYGDPMAQPYCAPELNTILPGIIAHIQSCGIRVGLTIRPQAFTYAFGGPPATVTNGVIFIDCSGLFGTNVYFGTNGVWTPIATNSTLLAQTPVPADFTNLLKKVMWVHSRYSNAKYGPAGTNFDWYADSMGGVDNWGPTNMAAMSNITRMFPGDRVFPECENSIPVCWRMFGIYNCFPFMDYTKNGYPVPLSILQHFPGASEVLKLDDATYNVPLLAAAMETNGVAPMPQPENANGTTNQVYQAQTNVWAAQAPHFAWFSQYGARNQTGADSLDPRAIWWLNNPTNWQAQTGQLGPGFTGWIEGVIDSYITISGSGAPGDNITLNLSDATMTAPIWNLAAAIYGIGVSNVVIDGGGTGSIYATDAGDGPTYDGYGCTGISFVDANNIWIQNLTVSGMYVTIPPTTNTTQLGTCINIGSSTVATGEGNVTISNVTCSYASTGINIGTGEPGWSNYVVDSCQIFGVNHGVSEGLGNTSASITNLNVKRSHIWNFANWDENASNPGWPNNHHDAIIVFSAASGGTITNSICEQNQIGPGFGLQSTGGYYASGFVQGNIVRNNIFNDSDGSYLNDAMVYWYPNSILYSPFFVLNNTFVGAPGGGAAIEFSPATSGLPIYPYCTNNLFLNVPLCFNIQYYAYFPSSFFDVDYSLYYGVTLTGAPLATGWSISANTSAAYLNYSGVSSWQSQGHDAHGVTGDPKLNGIYVPQFGSAAYQAGLVSAYVTNDFFGNRRLVGNDIGAVEAQIEITPPVILVGAPTGVKFVGTNSGGASIVGQ
jgi:hypothetical protein